MRDYNPSYTNDDLLALYTFTGGVPKYVELFCDNITLNIDEMISFMVRENSPLPMKGKPVDRRVWEKLCHLFLYPECHFGRCQYTTRNRNCIRR